MIGQRGAPARREPRGGLLDRPAGQAIDDPGVARMRARKETATAGRAGCAWRRPGRTGSGGRSRRQKPARRRARAGRRCRAGSARRRSRSAPSAARRGKRSCRTESCWYSGRKSWPHCEMQCASSTANSASRDRAKQIEATRRRQPLGRHVEQVERAVADRALDRRRFGRRQPRVQRRGAHPELAQRVDLVLHQRDQRRDDDAEARAQQCRDLVAQRFAAAGRHQHDGVAAGRDLLDHLLLRAAEFVKAKDRAQHAPRRRGCARFRVPSRVRPCGPGAFCRTEPFSLCVRCRTGLRVIMSASNERVTTFYRKTQMSIDCRRGRRGDDRKFRQARRRVPSVRTIRRGTAKADCRRRWRWPSAPRRWRCRQARPRPIRRRRRRSRHACRERPAAIDIAATPATLTPFAGNGEIEDRLDTAGRVVVAGERLHEHLRPPVLCRRTAGSRCGTAARPRRRRCGRRCCTPTGKGSTRPCSTAIALGRTRSHPVAGRA